MSVAPNAKRERARGARGIALLVVVILSVVAAVIVWVNIRLMVFQVMVCDGTSYTRDDGVTVTPMPGDGDDGCWTVPGGP